MSECSLTQLPRILAAARSAAVWTACSSTSAPSSVMALLIDPGVTDPDDSVGDVPIQEVPAVLAAKNYLAGQPGVAGPSSAYTRGRVLE
jgi:hypothetical protein